MISTVLQYFINASTNAISWSPISKNVSLVFLVKCNYLCVLDLFNISSSIDQINEHCLNILISVCWKLYTGINKTLASGKTSSFGLAKEIGEVEVGFNCYVKNRNEKRSESYFDDDFSNFFSSFGVGEDRNQPRHKQMGNYNSRFNSMPALMQIIWRIRLTKTKIKRSSRPNIFPLERHNPMSGMLLINRNTNLGYS